MPVPFAMQCLIKMLWSLIRVWISAHDFWDVMLMGGILSCRVLWLVVGFVFCDVLGVCFDLGYLLLVWVAVVGTFPFSGCCSVGWIETLVSSAGRLSRDRTMSGSQVIMAWAKMLFSMSGASVVAYLYNAASSSFISWRGMLVVIAAFVDWAINSVAVVYFCFFLDLDVDSSSICLLSAILALYSM